MSQIYYTHHYKGYWRYGSPPRAYAAVGWAPWCQPLATMDQYFVGSRHSLLLLMTMMLLDCRQPHRSLRRRRQRQRLWPLMQLSSSQRWRPRHVSATDMPSIFWPSDIEAFCSSTAQAAPDPQTRCTNQNKKKLHSLTHGAPTHTYTVRCVCVCMLLTRVAATAEQKFGIAPILQSKPKSSVGWSLRSGVIVGYVCCCSSVWIILPHTHTHLSRTRFAYTPERVLPRICFVVCLTKED